MVRISSGVGTRWMVEEPLRGVASHSSGMSSRDRNARTRVRVWSAAGRGEVQSQLRWWGSRWVRVTRKEVGGIGLGSDLQSDTARQGGRPREEMAALQLRIWSGRDGWHWLVLALLRPVLSF
jgi:hypothetical protein